MAKGTLSWRKLGVITGLFVLLFFCIGIIADQFVLPMIVGAGDVVRVPSVVDKNIDEALSTIASAGLATTDSKEQYSDSVPKGHVISQMPYAFASVKKGRRVYLTVSRGIQTLLMPSLIGKTIRDARLTLMREGLQLGDISYEYNDSIPRDRIIIQGVPSGSHIAAGTTTSVVISRGSGTTMMPDVLGMTLVEAQVLLTDRGLTIGSIKYTSSGTFESSTVIGQDPPADTPTNPAASVSLVVVK
ncbi:MAG: PASTA domain-containing protein [Ignavibacteria bacterium]|nr:PASTA domain-containing protein [Ignavibacteria bacterium]